MVRIEDNEELDIVKLLQIIWNGKITIISFITVSIFFVAGAFSVMPTPNFVATTEIKPVPPHQAELYRLSNSTGLFEVSSTNTFSNRCRDSQRDSSKGEDEDEGHKSISTASLQAIFVDLLLRGQPFREGFKKFSVLNRDNYGSDSEYELAIERLVSSIEVEKYVKQRERADSEFAENWVIKFEYNDEEKWLNVLDYVARATNEAVRDELKKQFATILESEKSKNFYKIEELQVLRSQLILSHTQRIKYRLAFLEEQAEIARVLGIEEYSVGSPSVEVRNFETIKDSNLSAQDSAVGVSAGRPFYLRGYKSIEKEIDLIRSREDIEPFVEGLSDIDQKINALRNSKSLVHAEELFNLTPAATGEGFAAVSISVNSTKFKTNSKQFLILVLVFLGSGTVGVLYVLISNMIRARTE